MGPKSEKSVYDADICPYLERRMKKSDYSDKIRVFSSPESITCTTKTFFTSKESSYHLEYKYVLIKECGSTLYVGMVHSAP